MLFICYSSQASPANAANGCNEGTCRSRIPSSCAIYFGLSLPFHCPCMHAQQATRSYACSPICVMHAHFSQTNLSSDLSSDQQVAMSITFIRRSLSMAFCAHTCIYPPAHHSWVLSRMGLCASITSCRALHASGTRSNDCRVAP